jgi:hypothetical protein
MGLVCLAISDYDGGSELREDPGLGNSASREQPILTGIECPQPCESRDVQECFLGYTMKKGLSPDSHGKVPANRSIGW